MRKTVFLSISLFVLLINTFVFIPNSVFVVVFPGLTWQTRTPGETGLDVSKLQVFSNYISGRGVVTRYGYMVYTWGDYKTKGDYASATKPWYTHFLLEAIESGKVCSINDKVNVFEPRLNTLNANLGYKDRNITWKDFSNQTSCYGVSEYPGTAFNYNDYQIALYADTLFTKVYGVSWDRVNSDILKPKLSNILQFEDGTMFDYPGTSERYGRILVSPRDFARFGILYLHDGNWNGTQVIPASLAKIVISSPLSNSLPGSSKISAEMIPGQRTIGSDVTVGHGDGHEPELGYSYTWWVNGLDKNGNRHWPGVPSDAYGAFGHAGE
ncbi:MAG: hypothetical protein AAB276_07575, partial [Pseudomonadota bacterium]